MSIVRCPHCGTANRAGSNFCNGCGTDLREGEPRRPASTEPYTEHPDDPFAEYAASGREPDQEPAEESGAGGEEAAPGEAASLDQPADAARDPMREPAPDLRDQPWLWLEFDAAEDADSDAGFGEEEGDVPRTPRMVTGVQGLLNPIRISTNISDDDEPAAPPAATPPIGLAPETLRIVRGLMAEPPPIRNVHTDQPDQIRGLRIPWIFVLVGLAVGLPALLIFAGPGGTPRQWPGVEAAYRTIQAVAPDTLVVVYWAYDPATAGELDLAMQPVARHLLERQARLAIVSTLPGGPATARRLIERVRTPDRRGDLQAAASLAQPVTYTYLPGGAAVLPLLAHDPAQALVEIPERTDPTLERLLERRPGLVVIAAAQAEDVQDWLEQVQPLEGSPVVAVTAAGADPIVRPYLDSGQLRGLVSGFDGAYNYRRLLDPFTAPASNERLLRQVAWQNWGHLAFIAAIILGNLAALLGRETVE